MTAKEMHTLCGTLIDLKLGDSRLLRDNSRDGNIDYSEIDARAFNDDISDETFILITEK